MYFIICFGKQRHQGTVEQAKELQKLLHAKGVIQLSNSLAMCVVFFFKEREKLCLLHKDF